MAMTLSSSRLAVLLVAVSMVLPLAGPAAAAPERPDRVLVRFAPDAGDVRGMAGVPALSGMRTGPRTGITIAEVARGASATEVARHLDAHPDVLWAEPDAVWHASALTDLVDDPYAEYLWGLDNTTADIDVDAPQAWEVTRGDPSVVVAVVDTGVDITHPDLAANVWTNPDEIPDNGIDDDGNGFADDVHGWDFHTDDASVYDDPQDDEHGTHVAGTIAALADNGRGIVGVAPQVTIMPLKFLGPGGSGWTSDAVAAIEYAAAMGADVVNASWGGEDSSIALSEAISRLDALFVAAAGNAGQDIDATPSYPAAYPHDTIVSVAAIDDAGRLPSWSNRGPTRVDLGAPGVDIVSTVPDGQYGLMSGTSMAAPHVAGVAALVHSVRPDLSPSAMARLLRDSTTQLSSLDGVTVTGGIVRADGAVRDAVGITTPGAVRHLDATAGDGRATVTWTAPTDDGGLPVADYVVTASPGDHRTTTTATRATLTDLTNGTSHTVTVAARTSAGTGPATSVTVTPLAAPTAPAPPPAEVDSPDDHTGSDEPVRTPDEPDDRTLDPVRLSGGDRYATAVAIARHAFPSTARDVYVATGEGFPDALAGTAAAAAGSGPVLLVGADHVPDAVADELVRLAPERIWVLGGPSAVSDAVVDRLGTTGAQVRRLAGPDRYTTSAVVSAHAFRPDVPVAYVGTGTSFPDALGAGAAAGRQGGPVLLTARDALPDAVAAELRRLQPRRVVVLGGAAAVDHGVVEAVGRASGAEVERIGGSTRYATSAQVVTDAFPSGVPAVLLATGEAFPDALAGGAAAATVASPVLLVPTSGPLPAATVDELRRLRPRSVIALGGTGALPDAVVDAVVEVTGGVAPVP